MDWEEVLLNSSQLYRARFIYAQQARAHSDNTGAHQRNTNECFEFLNT